MSDERYVKAFRGSDGLRYQNDAIDYGREMYDRWRAAEGQRVESIRWCETHDRPGGYGQCDARTLDNQNRRCVIVDATLILPPKDAA